MEAGSSLVFLPHPSVPHTGAHHTATNKFFLSENCNLVWGEVFTCGRMLKGERFSFTFYQSITEIYLQGKLVVKDNLVLEPATANPTELGQMEGYTHQASFICMGPNVTESGTGAVFQKVLEDLANISWGMTRLPVGGLLVRILGFKGEQLHQCLKSLAALLQAENANTPVYAG
jgi:urease accessory protein